MMQGGFPAGHPPNSVRSRLYAARFPADKAMFDLDCWHALEADHPLTFVGMYQFWAQKN
jgi:hypothetical protein